MAAVGFTDHLLQQCDFPDPGQGPIALAVSGGADSLALLVLAATRGMTAVAIHVDHGLRVDSDREADLVASAASQFGLAFESRSVTVEPGPDLEARARAARYQVLPEGVMTGHTMDDQAETVLLNILRGAALDGLAGMAAGADPARSGRQIRRPLLGIRRSETRDLCRLHGLIPFEDPTNTDDRFRRNRVRSEVLPLLCDVAQRDLVPVLARQAELLDADRRYLDKSASELDPTDTATLRDAPPALASRALRAWIRSHDTADQENHPPTAAELARVMEVVQGTTKACELSGGRRVERHRGRLELVRTGPAIGRPGGQVAFDPRSAGRVQAW